MADDGEKKGDAKGKDKKNDEEFANAEQLTREIQSAINRITHDHPQGRALLYLQEIDRRCSSGNYIKLATRRQILNDLLSNTIPSDRDMMSRCDRRPYHEWHSAVLLHDVHEDDDIPQVWRDNNHVMPFVRHIRDILNGVPNPCPLRKKGKTASKEGKKRKRDTSANDEDEDEEFKDGQTQQDSRRLAAQRNLSTGTMDRYEVSATAHSEVLNRPQLRGTPASPLSYDRSAMSVAAPLPSAHHHQFSGFGMSHDSPSNTFGDSRSVASQQFRMPASTASQLLNSSMFQRLESYLDPILGSQQTLHHHHRPQLNLSYRLPATPEFQDESNTSNGYMYPQHSATNAHVYQRHPGASGAASDATSTQLSRQIHRSSPVANLQQNASNMHHVASYHNGQITNAAPETVQQAFSESGHIPVIPEGVPDRRWVAQQPHSFNQQLSAVLPGSTVQSPYGQQPDVYRLRPHYHRPISQTDTAATHATRVGHHRSGNREIADHDTSQ